MIPQHSKVGINWQTLYIFIPGLNIWAAWRIQKLRKSLLFFLPIAFSVILFSRWMITVGEHVDTQEIGYLLSLITLAFFIIGGNFIIHYFRKWSRYWNEKMKKFVPSK